MKDLLKELGFGIGLLLVTAVFMALAGGALACFMRWTGAWSG